jgi:predicted exporter
MAFSPQGAQKHLGQPGVFLESRIGRRAVLIWLLALAACLTIVWRSQFTADMSTFLPKNPTPQQQLLVDQLKEGSLSRLLLIGIEGADGAGRARLSRELATRLQASGEFASVRNGDAAAMARDREILFKYRYLLSPAVTGERFSVAGLHQAVGDSIDMLASPAGLMIKGLLPRDPTGEMMELLGSLDADGGPSTANGVWVSRDGRRAMLMAQTAASGADTDGQERALTGLRASFEGALAATGIGDARMVFSGTPAFSVDTRATIRSEVERLAILSAVGISCLLLFVYRSVTALVLGLLPVLSGALAGIAAVSLGFGSVHGITIGFGTTLIGEAVDYSIYYFVQSQAAERSDRSWLEAFWPTIRLGVLTSICGFASLLFSGFPGLAQLGLYSIAGLVAAAAVTRFVLPHLCPAGFRIRDTRAIGLRLALLASTLGRLRWGVLVLAGVAAAVVATHRDRLWNTGLGDISPMPPAALALNQSLRNDLGAPDQHYLIVVSAGEREAALLAAEQIASRLPALVDLGVITGFETPTRFLPSVATQRARQAALPGRTELSARLGQALGDLPLRPEKLTPFLDDAEAAAHMPLLTPEMLAGSTLGLAVESMLLQRHSGGTSGWIALLPLDAPTTGPSADRIEPAAIQQVLNDASQPRALFVDLSGESSRLYADYLDEAVLLSLAGLLAIVVLLAATLRSAARLARVLAPLMAAVLLVMAGLALAGERLTLLHLVGLLLIVAVGSNYALFFDRAEQQGGSEPQTLASLLIANCTTVIGFGVLAFSKLPILHAIGITVGPGAVLALLLSAVLAGRPQTNGSY